MNKNTKTVQSSSWEMPTSASFAEKLEFFLTTRKTIDEKGLRFLESHF